MDGQATPLSAPSALTDGGTVETTCAAWLTVTGKTRDVARWTSQEVRIAHEATTSASGRTHGTGGLQSWTITPFYATHTWAYSGGHTIVGHEGHTPLGLFKIPTSTSGRTDMWHASPIAASRQACPTTLRQGKAGARVKGLWSANEKVLQERNSRIKQEYYYPTLKVQLYFPPLVAVRSRLLHSVQLASVNPLYRRVIVRLWLRM